MSNQQGCLTELEVVQVTGRSMGPPGLSEYVLEVLQGGLRFSLPSPCSFAAAEGLEEGWNQPRGYCSWNKMELAPPPFLWLCPL